MRLSQEMTAAQQATSATVKGALCDLGARVARIRLSRNLAQAHVAREAGISVNSVKRLEAGDNTSLDTLIRVLGVLGLGDRLASALPDPGVQPVERVRRSGHERQRARERKAVPAASDWAWGDGAEE